MLGLRLRARRRVRRRYVRVGLRLRARRRAGFLRRLGRRQPFLATLECFRRRDGLRRRFRVRAAFFAARLRAAALRLRVAAALRAAALRLVLVLRFRGAFFRRRVVVLRRVVVFRRVGLRRFLAIVFLRLVVVLAAGFFRRVVVFLRAAFLRVVLEGRRFFAVERRRPFAGLMYMMGMRNRSPVYTEPVVSVSGMIGELVMPCVRLLTPRQGSAGAPLHNTRRFHLSSSELSMASRSLRSLSPLIFLAASEALSGTYLGT